MTKLCIICILCYVIEDCVSGLDIRLTDQLGISRWSSPVNGYAEVFHNGFWIPICGNNWKNTGAQVLCRMLGYNASSYHVMGSSINCIYNISCTGTEKSLEECMGGIGYRSCMYSDKTLAYVRCGSGNKTSTDANPTGLGVRLVGATGQYEGRVELLALNQWMSIYVPNNTWSDREAAVVCRTLGFSTYDSKSLNIYCLNNVTCSGQEKSLDQCIYNTAVCEKGTFVYLQCGCIVSGCIGSGNYCDIVRDTCVTKCSPGSRFIGYCEPCLAGTYQPLGHQYSCSQCPAGTYQNRTGQTVCIACSSGSYQANAGQTSCDMCLAGTYQSQIGQTSCNPCPAGTYQYWSGQKSCLACELGTFQNSAGQILCLLCGKGMTTDRAGSDSYSDCHDEHPAKHDDHLGQLHMNLLLMGGYLMIGIAVLNIIVCIVVMKRTCLKSGKPRTRIS